MADVTVFNDVNAFTWQHSFRGQVFTTDDVGYQFYANASNNDLFYIKTEDGGATWGTPVSIRVGVMGPFDVWFDQWTPGNNGTLIHIAVIDLTPDDVFYYSLDTDDDTVSSVVTIVTGSTASALNANISITRARGGNLYCYFDLDGGTEHGFYRSVDAGANWTARTSPNESAYDQAILLPGNGADNQDVVAVWHDGDADALSLKEYDDSANTWPTETAIGSYAALDIGNYGAGFSAALRHTDNHAIVAFANNGENAANDIQVFDINLVIGSVTVTEKGNVLTNTAQAYNPVLAINQSSGAIYCAYNTGTDLQTSSQIFYKVSTNGGTSWGTQTAMMANAAGNVSNVHVSMGGTGTRFLPAWGLMAVNDVFVNVDNSVVFTAAGGLPGNSGNAPGRGRGNPNPGSGGGNGGGGGGQGGGGIGNPLNKGFLGTRRRVR